MKHIISCCLLALSTAQLTYAAYDKDTTPVQWTGGEFLWPCPSTKSIYKSSGKYVPKNIIATRAQISKDLAFVVLPRFKPGVPATVAVTCLKTKTCQALLEPFPCWSLQEEGNCNALQNAVDLFLDPHEILWVLDVGIVNTLENPLRKCKPKILGINIKTGKVVNNIDLCGLVCEASRLQYLVVDYAQDGRCFLYVSDAATRAILVYDVAAGKGYRLILPKAVTLGCARRDVLYLALIRAANGDNILYFTYLSSKRMFSIRTSYLQSGSTSGRVQDVGVKPDRMVILGTDNGGSMFFRYEGLGDVYQWNTATPFGQCNFKVVYRSPNCLLATQALADYKRGRMRVLESNFLDFIQGTVGCGAVQRLTVIEGVC